MSIEEGGLFHMSLMVVINQERDKVLYAKVNRNFVDILLSFLTLPLGTIVRLLVQNYGDEAMAIGSLNHLYKGLENLDADNFYFEMSKLMLLQPRNSFEVQCRKLIFNFDDAPPIKYYICEGGRCSYFKSVGLYYDKMTCYCGRSMNLEVSVEDSNAEVPSEGGVFVTLDTQSFIVTDDFRISPYLPELEKQILLDSGVDHTDVLQERSVVFGYSQMMLLLECLLLSKTPLTDTILSTREMIFSKCNQQVTPFVDHKGKRHLKSKCKKMKVTAFVQKSTNKILAVHAQEDFANFIFGLLAIPLGKAEFLLDGDSCLGSIGNLYSSVANLISGKCISTKDEPMNTILNPKLAPKYASWFKQILPLAEQSPHVLVYSYNGLTGRNSFKMVASRDIPKHDVIYSTTIDPEGLKPNGFLVADNLDVTIAFTSWLSRHQQMGVPLQDIEEQVLDIGSEEAVNILKASLTSSCALTNGLKQCLLRQQSEKGKGWKIISRVPRWC